MTALIPVLVQYFAQLGFFGAVASVGSLMLGAGL